MATHIKIGSEFAPRDQQKADGTQKVFTFKFPIFKDADLAVYLDDTLQESGADYNVAGAGESAGGSVTFDVVPVAETNVTLARRLPIERMSDFQESGEFRSKVLNDELDIQTAVLQQLDDAHKRSLHISPFDPTEDEMYLPTMTERAGRVMGFDDLGLPVMSSKTIEQLENAVVTADAVAVAVDSAAAAAISAAAAQGAVQGVKVSDDDTGAGNLEAKLIAGSGLVKVVDSSNGIETYTLTMNGSIVPLLAQANTFTKPMAFALETTSPQLNIHAGDPGTKAGVAAIDMKSGSGVGGGRLWGIENRAGDYALTFVDRASTDVVFGAAYLGGLFVGAVSGGAKGPSTINAGQYYVNGVAVYAARAYIVFDGTSTSIGTGSASKNVLSVTDNGPGDYIINFVTPFSTANYVGNVQSGSGSATQGRIFYMGPEASDPTTSSYRIRMIDTNGTFVDAKFVQAVFFGD